jgi:hypothetical protein
LSTLRKSPCLESELGAAFYASEAAAVEEGVVLEGPDLVGGVDCLPAPEAVAVHVVGLEHVDRCRHLAGGLLGCIIVGGALRRVQHCEAVLVLTKTPLNNLK